MILQYNESKKTDDGVLLTTRIQKTQYLTR